jgi:hypothetical protein
MRYAIKVSGGGRMDGEYDGANTIPAAVKRAKLEFVPYVEARASVRVVRFSRDGLHVITVATVKESTYGDRGSRLSRTRS